MGKKKAKGWVSENKDYMRAMQDLRRSSASQRHTLKKYKGSRSDRKRKEIALFD